MLIFIKLLQTCQDYFKSHQFQRTYKRNKNPTKQMEILLILPKLRGKYILRVLATKNHSLCVIAIARKKIEIRRKKRA